MPIYNYGFNPILCAHATAYILLRAERPLSVKILGHWLYIAERRHAKNRGHAIFRDYWLATQEGPICFNAVRGLLGLSSNPIWNQLIDRKSNDLISFRGNVHVDNLDYLSQATESTCSSVISEFNTMTENELIDWMFLNLPENVAFNKHNRTITAAALALSIGFPDAEYFAEADAESRSIHNCFSDNQYSDPNAASDFARIQTLFSRH